MITRPNLYFVYLATLALAQVEAVADESPLRPNIIFILADDLGYGDLGCYGQQRIKTPHLDRLAAEGIRFTQFYSGATVCAPSRCVLMTGRHGGRASIRGNSREHSSLPAGEITVARILKTAGYATGCIGKWGLGDPGAPGVPTQQGFDEFFGYLNHQHAHNYYPTHLWRGRSESAVERVALRNTVPNEGANGQGVADQRLEYAADVIADEALGFIRRCQERPFFLYFAPTAPHANNEARAKGMEVPDYGEYAGTDWPEPQKGHAAMITRLDRDVGRIVSLLQERKIDQRTLILFSSDNGPHREGGADPDWSQSSGPLRGLKRDHYDGGIRVPFIAHWPGHIAAGSTSAQVGYLGDFLATAIELTGAAAPAEHDGISIAPTLLGNGQQKQHSALYWEFHERGFSQAALFDGRWKAIRNGRLDTPVEIYDLANDIAESRNVAVDKPELVTQAREWFVKARSESPSWPIREARPPVRPNVLWITCEDTGPQLGSYGCVDAITPRLDELAARGVRYTRVWSNAPVCAPARTAIITGIYPTSCGAEPMRSLRRLPPGIRMFPALLREAGYYTSNNAKEDYNLEKTPDVWDESSKRAHWRQRRPGQPFFAVFNLETTHESQIRQRPHSGPHDPAKVRLPAYHPDAPEARAAWAQYHDKVTEMDAQAGKILDELAADGLANDTVIFFFGDHGAGLPRLKRNACDSGLRVPMIVVVPEKFRALAPPEYAPGSELSRLVSFVDLAPTVLALAGLEPPQWQQGGAFLGAKTAAPPAHNFGFRGRMDERIDLVRAVTDGRFVYVRNYMPWKIPGQHVEYLFETPMTREWKQLYDAGKLAPPQTAFWEPRAPEELYDLDKDPDETRNLAASSQHTAKRQDLRDALRRHLLAVRDAGFLPEAESHRLAAGGTVHELVRDRERYPLERVLETAEMASSLDSSATARLRSSLMDADSAVRFWAATGLGALGKNAVAEASTELRSLLTDVSPSVRIAVAQTLGQHGEAKDIAAALKVLEGLAAPDQNGLFAAVEALNAIETLGDRAAPLHNYLKTIPRFDPGQPQRTKDYAERLLRSILREAQ